MSIVLNIMQRRVPYLAHLEMELSVLVKLYDTDRLWWFLYAESGYRSTGRNFAKAGGNGCSA
jgi:hypothetical protein